MKDFSKKIKKLLFFISCCPFLLFGAGGTNIASTIATNANTQIAEAGKSVASVINTMAIVMGVLWIIVMLFMLFFNMEGIKQHAKMLFGALVVIGIIFGLSAASM